MAIGLNLLSLGASAVVLGLSSSALAQQADAAPIRTCEGQVCAEQCQPQLVIDPLSPNVKASNPVVISFSFPGLSKSGHCAKQGNASIDWKDGTPSVVPSIALGANRACGDAGNQIIDASKSVNGTFTLSHLYGATGDHYPTVVAWSEFEFKTGQGTNVTYRCEISRTIKATVLP